MLIVRNCIKCSNTSDKIPFRKGRNICIPCKNLYAKEYAIRNPEKRKTWDDKYNTQEKAKISRKAITKRHKEKIKADPVKKLNKAKESLIRSKKWKAKNREKINEANRKYKRENPHIINEQRMRRRAREEQGSLSSFDIKKIRQIYKICSELNKENPGKYQVDHIIPLNNINVSGLHVAENLQILEKKDNLKKSNKWDGTYNNNSWKNDIS